MQPAARNTFLTSDRRLALVWRVLSYLFCFIVVNLLANIARVVLENVGVPLVICRLVFTLLYITGVIGLTYVYRRSIDLRSWQGIALPPLRTRLRDVTVGVLVGIVTVVLVFGLEYSVGWLRVVGTEHGSSALILILDSLLVSLAFGVCEEICFRGYLFQNIAETSTIWLATLITGVIFSAFHLLEVGFDARGGSFLLFILLLHVFFVLMRLLTRSLWLAIGLHLAFDWGAIIVGLGAVVSANRHLLQLERTTSLIAEDLLSALVIALGMLLCIWWAWRSNRQLHWHARLAQKRPLPSRFGLQL